MSVVYVCLSTSWKALIFKFLPSLPPDTPPHHHRSLSFGSLFYFGLSFQGCCVLIRGQAALIVSYFSLQWKVLLWCWHLPFTRMLIFLNICQQIKVHITCWFCLFVIFILSGHRVCLMWFWTFPFSKHVEMCMRGTGVESFYAGVYFPGSCRRKWLCLVTTVGDRSPPTQRPLSLGLFDLRGAELPEKGQQIKDLCKKR